MRRTILSVATGALTGILAIGVAWSTAGLAPVGGEVARESRTALDPQLLEQVAQAQAANDGTRLPGGVFRVGAAKVSLAPKPLSEGGPWMRHGKDGNCPGQSTLYAPGQDSRCLRTFDSNWATGVDSQYDMGVWVRAMTISNGEETVAFAVMDLIGYFAGYPEEICGDCGIQAITQDLESSLGIPAENMVISSTHVHSSADTVMATPSWYFELVRDAVKEAITEAYASEQLATIEIGATSAKAFNVDRRIVTRAVPDYELTWFRANAIEPQDPAKPSIAHMVNFSVHPTITAGNRELHSGLVGHLAERLEGEWGGTTLFTPAGLGDQTVNRGFGRDGFGYGLAEVALRSQQENGYTLQSNEIVAEQRILRVPVDNSTLLAGNLGGIFVREDTIPGPFADGPWTSVSQRGGANTPSCVAASPVSLYTPVGGIRIGTPGQVKQRAADGTWAVLPGDPGDALVIMSDPGEAFSSIASTTKDYLSRSRVTMLIGLANDTIGYIIPSEQYDMRGANPSGLAQPSLEMANYEESLSSGRCTGDQVQNALLEIGQSLGVMGDGEGR